MNSNHKYLSEKYDRLGLTREDLAKELTCSISTIDRLLKEGVGLPSYKRIGEGKRARIIFPVSEVAKYMDEHLIVMK
jgi:predicted DNA-binding transcriptional regulator AlpA